MNYTQMEGAEEPEEFVSEDELTESDSAASSDLDEEERVKREESRKREFEQYMTENHELPGSIYTCAVVYPLAGHVLGTTRGQTKRYFAVAFFLALNYCMQAVFLASVIYGSLSLDSGLALFHEPSEEARANIWTPWSLGAFSMGGSWDPEGVCHLVPWGDFDPENPFEVNTSAGRRLKGGHGRGGGGKGKAGKGKKGPKKGMLATQGSASLISDLPKIISLVGVMWLDCVPRSLKSMLSWNLLDVDGDGIWMREEAKTTRARKTFDAWMELLKDLPLDLQAATLDYTIFPRNVFLRTRYVMDLCGLYDKKLCGNLEVEGALSRFEHVASPHERIDLCMQIIDFHCPRLLHAEYSIYQIKHPEICGTPSLSRAESKNQKTGATVPVQTVSYSNIGSCNERISATFDTFLSLIVVTWLLALCNEFGLCWQFWEFVWRFPGPPSEEEKPTHALSHADGGKFQLNYFPLGHRIFLILMVALPRSIMVLWLFKAGSDFLSLSEDYLTAILNSLGLAFIIEVDKMIFDAVLSLETQKLVAGMNPANISLHRMVASRFTLKCPCWSATTCYVVLIASIAALYNFVNLLRPFGWKYQAEAVRCFCHGTGSSCMSSWRLIDTLNMSVPVPEPSCWGFTCDLFPGWASPEGQYPAELQDWFVGIFR